MAHNLFLGMYTFSIKKKRKKKENVMDNNDFLELAYPNIKTNKFHDGFVKDIISLFDKKVYKNAKNTHGATLDDLDIDGDNRIFDLMIDGGITGIQQYLIKDDGKKSELSAKDIVGPKFYARFWLPAGSSTGYVFVQKYGAMSIKPIFDSILKDLLNKYNCSIANSTLKASTTKERLKEFIKKAVLKNITIVSKESANSTNSANASTVEVKLKNIKPIRSSKKKNYRKEIEASLAMHGFTIGNKPYLIKGVYEYDNDGVKEERTAFLDATEETINIVPNLVVPLSCIDGNNYPIFERMVALTNDEMKQVAKEAKL